MRKRDYSLYGRGTEPRTIGDVLPKALGHPSDKDGAGSKTLFAAEWAIARKRLTRMGCSEEMIEAACKVAAENIQKGQALCESPIERRILVSLVLADYDGFLCDVPRVHDCKMENMPDHEIVIVPQFAFVKYRFDFAIACMVGDHSKLVAIECDGAEFHDHKRAPSDRARNGYLASWGIETFRFTGSDIHQNAHMRAGEVAAHLSEWRRGVS